MGGGFGTQGSLIPKLVPYTPLSASRCWKKDWMGTYIWVSQAGYRLKNWGGPIVALKQGLYRKEQVNEKNVQRDWEGNIQHVPTP